ncbi:MAG: prepilin-type N-terminal cleavage/methylation domain-containing protein [Vulcanimicrobiota bacterium]
MKSKGFTLIELMIVIAIIAILASIIIPNISRARARAQLTTCMANQKSLITVLTMWVTDHPGREDEFSGGRLAGTNHSLCPDYVGLAPTCPASGNYYYACVNSCNDGERFRLHTDDDSPGVHKIINPDLCCYFGYTVQSCPDDSYQGWCSGTNGWIEID